MASKPTSRQEALDYHSQGRPGKIEVVSTKPTNNQYDLSLAYSPGVAEPCREIAEDVSKVYDYTARGNLVAVISDGSAVLGLGNIGPEASKPVMEGKGVLFKRFADIDVFDIELATQDVDEIVAAVKAIAPTVSGINLEDISAPRCFEMISWKATLPAPPRSFARWTTVTNSLNPMAPEPSCAHGTRRPSPLQPVPFQEFSITLLLV